MQGSDPRERDIRVEVVIDQRWNGQSTKASKGVGVCVRLRRNMSVIGRQFWLADVKSLGDAL